jgi:hypothetical protein
MASLIGIDEIGLSTNNVSEEGIEAINSSCDSDDRISTVRIFLVTKPNNAIF